jgi:hypothetical protein
VQHEALTFSHYLKVGELRLLSAWINVAVAVIAEDAEDTVKVQVNRGWLHIAIIKRLNRNLTGDECGA